MALAPTCPRCGTLHFSTQPCPADRAPRRADKGPGTTKPRPAEKIAEGLREAIAVVKGEKKAARTTIFFGLRMDEETIEKIDLEAKKLGISRSRAARTILQKAMGTFRA